MHEARMRQALRELETNLGQHNLSLVAIQILIATGHNATEENIAQATKALTLHVAQFAPVLDSLDLD